MRLMLEGEEEEEESIEIPLKRSKRVIRPDPIPPVIPKHRRRLIKATEAHGGGNTTEPEHSVSVPEPSGFLEPFLSTTKQATPSLSLTPEDRVTSQPGHLQAEHTEVSSQTPLLQLPLTSYDPIDFGNKMTSNEGEHLTASAEGIHESRGHLEDQLITSEVRTHTIQGKEGASGQWYEELDLVARADLLSNIMEMVRRGVAHEAQQPKCTMPDHADFCGASRERDSELTDLESQLKEVSEENLNLVSHNEWLESQLANLQKKAHTTEEEQKTADLIASEMQKSQDQLVGEKKKVEDDLIKAKEEISEVQQREREKDVELSSLSWSYKAKMSDLEKKILELESENRALNLALPTEEDRVTEQENIIADYTSSSTCYSALEEQANAGFEKGWTYARLRSKLLGNAHPLGNYHDLSLSELEKLNSYHKKELGKGDGEEDSDADP